MSVGHVPSQSPGPIGLAWRESTADGLRRFLPFAVGLIVVGVPLCLLATFAHFVLGVSLHVSVPATLSMSGGIALGSGGAYLVRRAVQR